MRTDRQFAADVTGKLQAAGFTALFAGGCVRDDLLGLTPKDYDVATNATPGEVRELFGYKRTLAIGESFGVITVLGPRSVQPIEVATFRRDGGYSDGRRPDSVEFTDAREDAERRDFTINGMFYDPLTDTVIDYVGGQDDLKRKLIRAIGDAAARIQEDKLRMLRGVRFAATYRFSIEAQTLAAIQNMAPEINAVSPERIGAELTRMFGHPNYNTAYQLLLESNLWQEVLPRDLLGDTASHNTRLHQMDRLRISSGSTNQVAAVIAILLRPVLVEHDLKKTGRLLAQLQHAWKLSNERIKSIGWIVNAASALSDCHTKKWSEVQPWLIPSDADVALDVLEAVDVDAADSVAFAREKRTLPKEALNPQPFLTGQDLIAMGITPGPRFKTVLQAIRAGQLDGEIKTREQALQRAATL
jgi:tRNA nucleotidyltransferase/poly(A) polymerase